MTASVLIRVDSSIQMGSGHLMRCLTLADELRRRGALLQFVCRDLPGNLCSRLEDSGYDVVRLLAPTGNMTADPRTWLGVAQRIDAEEVTKALAGRRFDWVIVDHYGLDIEWERLARAIAARVFVIDDLANREHDADVLLDQNYFGTATTSRYEQYVATRCVKLLGPQFALLQPVYRHLRAALVSRDDGVNRVLVFFGAHDKARTVLAVVKGLQEQVERKFVIDVVPGNDPEICAGVKALACNAQGICVHDNPPSLAYLLARADIAIGACGTTTWERACLGVPTIAVTIADNQVESANALAAEDYIELAGSAGSLSVDEWSNKVRDVMASSERLKLLSEQSLRLTDGHGVGRAASIIANDQSMTVSVRRASHADESLLLRWANDFDVRRNSFSSDQISPEVHRKWFGAKLADVSCVILIGSDRHGLPIGQVRFDLNAHTQQAVIDVSIESALRGLGLSTKLLLAALEYLRSRRFGYTAVAEVIANNLPSQRLFAAAGFSPSISRQDDVLAFELRL
jgi:UDP-2,4-diacetamido-2,4,6-trideoxy-beta-L-altropyranose hydrolase